MRRGARSTLVLWLLAVGCGPPSVVAEGASGSEGGEDEFIGESCASAEPALLEVVLNPAGINEIDECVVSIAEQDPDDARRWTFVFACSDPVELQLVLDPPLLASPFEVGDPIAVAIIDDSPGIRIIDVVAANFHGLSILDYRGPPELPEFLSEPRLIDSPDFDWTPAGCGVEDTSCGAVEALGVSITDDGLELGMLGPEQRHIQVEDPESGEPRSIWIGENWTGSCDGEPMQALSYVVVSSS